jgi:hypothetical protein
LFGSLFHRCPGNGFVRLNEDLAGVAVHQNRRTCGDLGEIGHRDDARDAELAGDDRGVAGRSAEPGREGDGQLVEAGGVGGGEIVGDQHRRLGRMWYAGLRPAGEFGDDPVADVVQIGDALGHQAAELGEQRGELVSRGGTRVDSVGAGLDPLRRRRAQAAITGQVGGRAEHLGGRTGGESGALGESSGDGGRGGVVPGDLGGPIGLGDGGRGRDRRARLGADHRAVADARYDGNALGNVVHLGSSTSGGLPGRYEQRS